jgi:hypothetical protein
MIAPPTNGYRILIYGQDSPLLETRRLLLASAGFRVNTVSNLRQLRDAVSQAQPPYELLILCHTVPLDQRETISSIALDAGAGVYQLDRGEQPIIFRRSVAEMMANS